MATAPLMRSLSTRSVKKLEKPRPLKISAGQPKISNELSPRVPLQDIMVLVENISQSLLDKVFDEKLNSNIAYMCSKLKTYGPQLETIFQDQLDRAFAIFRDGCKDDRLNCTARLHLLELVELRANQWSNCDNTLIYYSAKMASAEIEPIVMTPTLDAAMPSSPIPPVLNPGEVLKTSGKFPKPTKIPGKNYCKDEVVIRNSDSGKVNPGAKERLVQITGPSEDKIINAKQLIEDTIRRNASPVREGHERHGRDMGGSSSSLNSSASDESNRQSGSRRSIQHSFSTNDASHGEYRYKHTVVLGNDSIKITGSNCDTVMNAKLVLEEYYNTWLQKNCSGDCYGVNEDVFLDHSIPDLSMLRLNSVDSGNGNGPSTSSGDSDDITCISTVPTSVTSIDPPLSYRDMYEIPQPEGRAVLGRSNSIPSPQSQVEVCYKYSRTFLLDCAFSDHSRVKPPNWEQISVECPAIAKKDGSFFDPKAFAKRITPATHEPTSD